MEQDRYRETPHTEDEDQSRAATQNLDIEESPLYQLGYSPTAQLGFMLAGVILPAICFILVAPSNTLFFETDPRTGRLTNYSQLMFSLWSCLPFYPFLLYSMACMTCMIVKPREYSQLFLVRLGIYTGVPLAIQYFVLLGYATHKVDFTTTPLLALLIWGFAWLIARFASFQGIDGPAVSTAIVVGDTLTVALIIAMPIIFLLFFFLALSSSTTWAIIAYTTMSRRLLRRNKHEPWQFSLAQLLIFVSWLAAYCSAWKIAVMVMPAAQ